MSRSTIGRVFALLLALGVFAAACGDSGTDSSSSSEAPATTAAPSTTAATTTEAPSTEAPSTTADGGDAMAGPGLEEVPTVTLGLAYGVTDPALESLTSAAIEAVQAVADLAREAGLDVNVVIEDTAGDPAQGVDAANKLVAQGASCILGEARSSVSTPIVAVAREAQIPQISWGSTSPALTTIDDNDFFFRTVLSDAVQGQVAADYLYNTLGYRSATVIVQNDAYGVGLGNAFEDAFTALGGEIKSRTDIDSGTTDMSAEVDKVVADGSDVIYTVLFGPEFIPFVTELDQADAASVQKMFLADAEATPDASAGVEDIVVGLSGLKPAGGDLSAFATYFNEQTGTDTAPFTEFSWDAAVMCLASAAAANSNDPVAIRDAIRPTMNDGTQYTYNQIGDLLHAAHNGEDVDYVGAGSTLDIDANGDVVPANATYSVWSFDDTGAPVDGEILTYQG